MIVRHVLTTVGQQVVDRKIQHKYKNDINLSHGVCIRSEHRDLYIPVYKYWTVIKGVVLIYNGTHVSPLNLLWRREGTTLSPDIPRRTFCILALT